MLRRTSGHFGGNQYCPARFRTVDRYERVCHALALSFLNDSCMKTAGLCDIL